MPFARAHGRPAAVWVARCPASSMPWLPRSNTTGLRDCKCRATNHAISSERPTDPSVTTAASSSRSCAACNCVFQSLRQGVVHSSASSQRLGCCTTAAARPSQHHTPLPIAAPALINSTASRRARRSSIGRVGCSWRRGCGPPACRAPPRRRVAASDFQRFQKSPI